MPEQQVYQLNLTANEVLVLDQVLQVGLSHLTPALASGPTISEVMQPMVLHIAKNRILRLMAETPGCQVIATNQVFALARTLDK